MKTLFIILFLSGIAQAGMFDLFNNPNDSKYINIKIKILKHSELQPLAELLNVFIHDPNQTNNNLGLFFVPEDIYILIYSNYKETRRKTVMNGSLQITSPKILAERVINFIPTFLGNGCFHVQKVLSAGTAIDKKEYENLFSEPIKYSIKKLHTK
jgi:hypothetical protein